MDDRSPRSTPAARGAASTEAHSAARATTSISRSHSSDDPAALGSVLRQLLPIASPRDIYERPAISRRAASRTPHSPAQRRPAAIGDIPPARKRRGAAKDVVVNGSGVPARADSLTLAWILSRFSIIGAAIFTPLGPHQLRGATTSGFILDAALSSPPSLPIASVHHHGGESELEAGPARPEPAGETRWANN